MSDPSLEPTTWAGQITRVRAYFCTTGHHWDPIMVETLHVKSVQSHGLIDGGDAGCAAQPAQMTAERCEQVQRLATGVAVEAERGDRGEEDRVNTGGPLPPPMADQGVAHVWAGTFGIAAAMSGWGWHAVDLELLAARPAAAHGRGRRPGGVEVFLVCGARANMVDTLRPFIYGSRWQAVLARLTVVAAQSRRPTLHPDRWIRTLQHRIDHCDAALSGLGQTRAPPLTEHAYGVRTAWRRDIRLRRPTNVIRAVVADTRPMGRAAMWAGQRTSGEAPRVVGDAWVQRQIAASLTDEPRAGPWPSGATATCHWGGDRMLRQWADVSAQRRR